MNREKLPVETKASQGGFLSHPFEALHHDMERLFDQYMPQRINRLFFNENQDIGFAKMDVTETKKTIDVRIDVPGVDEDDIEITLKDNMLTICGNRESSVKEESEGYQRSERSFGSFVRRVMLPSEVDEGKIDALVKNGVLNLHMKKTGKAIAKEHKIKIKKQ